MDAFSDKALTVEFIYLSESGIKQRYYGKRDQQTEQYRNGDGNRKLTEYIGDSPLRQRDGNEYHYQHQCDGNDCSAYFTQSVV